MWKWVQREHTQRTHPEPTDFNQTLQGYSIGTGEFIRLPQWPWGSSSIWFQQFVFQFQWLISNDLAQKPWWPASVMKSRATRMLVFWEYPLPSHDYLYNWFILEPKSKQGKVTKLWYLWRIPILECCKKTLHVTQLLKFLIRCIYRKWIHPVSLKIQSRHNSFHRQMDRWARWNKYTPLSTSLKLGVL